MRTCACVCVSVREESGQGWFAFLKHYSGHHIGYRWQRARLRTGSTAQKRNVLGFQCCGREPLKEDSTEAAFDVGLRGQGDSVGGRTQASVRTKAGIKYTHKESQLAEAYGLW